MSRKIIRSPKYPHPYWAILLLVLIFSTLLVSVPLFVLYYRISKNMGEGLAEIVFTFLGGGLLLTVFGGAGLGLGIDYAIRHGMYIFCDPQPGSWVYITIRLWGYAFQENPEVETDPLSQLPEIPYQLPEKACRKGRKPQFSVKDWAEVALVWEQRDPSFDLFSLEDVICQKLGVAADGAPIISAKAYRGTWRIPAIRYINQHGLAKKPLPENLNKVVSSKG